MADRTALIGQIQHPEHADGTRLRKDLHLDLPEPADVFEDIEKNLLLPPRRIPSHWLPSYQMSGWFSVSFLNNI